MLFNSYQFFIFFPVVTVLFFILPHRCRWALLLVASCIFYAAFIPAYLLILFGLIVVDYGAGRLIESAAGKVRRYYLWLSILANGGTLFFFKYFNFFNATIASLAHVLNVPYTAAALTVALPIGLSFHTFQSLSYVVEVYRGNQKAEKHFGIYALYVMFYPQLVAGPIERPQQLLPQLHARQSVDYVRIAAGLRRMLWGFFKKMVIADNLAAYVTIAYAAPHTTPELALFVATLFFAVQIYCDFSGYTDIALGAAQVMGITLVENFNIPYAATTITEFWRRWHMSLSSWVRDYIFTPLSITWRRNGKVGIVAALLVAFLFIGFWHGAAWVFVVFGLMHGLAVSIEFLTVRPRTMLAARMPSWISTVIGRIYVFFFWCATLVFFRSGSLADALAILHNSIMGVAETFLVIAHARSVSFVFQGIIQPILLVQGSRLSFVLLVCLCIAVLLTEVFDYTRGMFTYVSKLPAPARFILYVGILFMIMNFGVTNEVPFIYFQF